MLHHRSAWATVDDGEPSAPLEVGNEGGAEARIGRQSHLVRDLRHATDPVLPLLLRDPPVAVLGEHVLVATTPFGVGLRATEGLRKPCGDVLRMIRIHAAEERLEHRIGLGEDGVVEARGEPLQRLDPPDPIEEGRDLLDQLWGERVAEARIPVRAVTEGLVA